MKKIYVNAFSTTPGGRYRSDGPWSGEEFREDVLLPAVRMFWPESVEVVFDGAFGYASVWLEEVFGGLIRRLGEMADAGFELELVVTCSEDPALELEVSSYLEDALGLLKAHTSMSIAAVEEDQGMALRCPSCGNKAETV